MFGRVQEYSMEIEIPKIRDKIQNEGDSYIDINCHPALDNDVILSRIFHMLQYEDIKMCRRVCMKWRNTCEHLFRKQSRIQFLIMKDLNEPDNSDKVKELSKKLSAFLHSVLSRTPDIAAAIGIIPWSLIPESVLAHFLYSERNNISDLKLSNIDLKDKYGKRVPNYEIRKLIGEKNTWLTTLYVSSSQFNIVLNDIPMIENLSLKGCSIVLNGGKISPKNVSLLEVQFLRKNSKGEFEDSMYTVVNEFLNFERINSLELNGCSRIARKKIRLDMSNPEVSVKSLSMSDVEVDWEYARWEVRNMTLVGISFLMKSPVKIMELEIRSTQEEIDLAALPESIEQIHLHENTICTSPISFPKLKYLHIWNTRCVSLLPYFSKCVNMEFLELTLVCKNFKVDVRDIPKNVKTIKVHFADDWISGDETFKFNRLILGWQNVAGFTNSLRQLKPEHLVIAGYFMVYEESHRQDVETLMELINGPFKTVAIGRFIWKDEILEEHPLLSIVDKKGEFYLFKNKLGKVITHYEFHKMMSL